ncbi:triphosphoribosyl-dephospho-CoA synthase [Schlegelella sp. ID0723]|uniref:triphosphoribosyl-dephospho-CoA synthase n=2 Tax=Piscinibacter koreensis TaxID=2742824 RepID=A0A7Y6NNK9_9BURK|nr:triphosphoribosyl-dephospho-CoA synthase [Schlegelella koreensis]
MRLRVVSTVDGAPVRAHCEGSGRAAAGAAPPCASLDATLRRIARAATAALYDELALHPKPGLVSFVDRGSHADMDATTFMRSLFALRHYFAQVTALGACGAAFEALEGAGIAAERRMLRATGGINTHRGAVFTLGLLCAAAGRCAAAGELPTAEVLRRHLQQGWGAALHARAGAPPRSPAAAAARAAGLASANDEAARGFPVLFDAVWPALCRARGDGVDPQGARLDALLAAIASLDDTNLLRRGGRAGLDFARDAAARWLAQGGARRVGAVGHLEALHRDFVRRRLSPGGAADMLAAACWLERVSR